MALELETLNRAPELANSSYAEGAEAGSARGAAHSLLGENSSETRFFPAEEVAKHKTLSDLWIVIDGNVYDITKWIPDHPGGTAPVTYGGKDATGLFKLIHNKGVLERHSDLLIGITNMEVASTDLGDDASKKQWYDAKADPLGYDKRTAGEVDGTWGAEREFGDRMALEGDTTHIPFVILTMYGCIALWSGLAHFIAGCGWWAMFLFYLAGMVAFYLWHRLAHSEWTGEMHECHMEHHLIRFPPSDFYGSAEMFAVMYPDGMPTIWSLMNLATTTNVANTKHTPMIHEGPLFVFLFVILVVAYFACGCSALTTLFGFIMYAVMGTVGNAFHMSFHIRGFHLEKYNWYLELRALHYIHHLGDMKMNFGMVNMGFETIFQSLAIEDPATKSKSPVQTAREVCTSAPTSLPEGITREKLRRTTQHFGIAGAMLGMGNTPEPSAKTTPAIRRGYPTVLLRILITCGAVHLWYLTEEYAGNVPETSTQVSDVNDPGHSWLGLHGFSPHSPLIMGLCAASQVLSELIVIVCIAGSILGTTFRPFLSVILTFVLRHLIRLSGALHHMPTPETIWSDSANMPHLFVQAGTSNLFFSGRVALATIALCELIDLSFVSNLMSDWKSHWRFCVLGLGICIVLYTVWLSLALRASWSFDCLIAFIVARYSSMIAARYSRRLDAMMP